MTTTFEVEQEKPGVSCKQVFLLLKLMCFALSLAAAVTLAQPASGVRSGTVAAHARKVISGTPVGAVAQPAVLYVSPHGHGEACTRSSPCSLTAAKYKVEGLNHHMTADIDVDLLGGTYRLPAGITLGPSDSGNESHNVVWQALPGQSPVISGAIHVTGFTEYDKARNIWRARVPASAAAVGGQQLFVDGQRAQLARGTAPLPGLKATSTGFSTTDSSVASFSNQSQIQVVDNSDWKHESCPVASITAAPDGRSDINILPGCWQANHVHVPNLGFPYNGAGMPIMSEVTYVENAYELLTQPGQFYLNKKTRYLFYIPLQGQKMAGADVELPVLRNLLTVQGAPGHLALVNQTSKDASYSGAGWQYSSNRNFGDLDNDVEVTTINGDSMSYTFHGTGLEVLGETGNDEGSFKVFVDGRQAAAQKPAESTTAGDTRLAQQVICSVYGLPQAKHVVKIVKTGGNSLTIDGFVVIPTPVHPVRNITFRNIDFEYSTWNTPATGGYIDNQAGVLWDTSGSVPAPVMVPAAVTVSRGSEIFFVGDVFSHLGASAIYLTNGTQHSTVFGCAVTDTAGGGIYVGQVDDYFQNKEALMTLGDTVSENQISNVGLDYSDTVGIWAGYTRGLTLSQNTIEHTPYSGISIGWGWGYASACKLQAAQGLHTCKHGTNYAGGNTVSGNRIDDVMRVLHDGGAIYTLGGQGEAGARVYSLLTGNYVSTGNHDNNMLYHDEGSSFWHTWNNVVSSTGRGVWIGMWTPTINEITVGPHNYSSTVRYYIRGTSISYTPPTVVSNGDWPAAARAIMKAAGAAHPSSPQLAEEQGQPAAEPHR